MTELRLVTDDFVSEGPFSDGTPLPRRLPPGRHQIPANVVSEHQRQRLLSAMAETIAEHGYASVTTTTVSELAGVSTSTFYKHFGNLWDCVLAAYVATSDQLCATIEDACSECDPRQDPLDVGIEAALSFCVEAPAAARLLCAQAPLEASAVAAARRILISRLAAMLRRGSGAPVRSPQPPGLDERLIDATFVFVGSRIATAGPAQLRELAPELATILSRPRQAA
jgi:AcrR family transcriptional regulator